MSRGLVSRLSRRSLSLVVAAIRHSGLLPKSFPDGLGEDKKLLGRTLDAQVVVYFADTVRGLYQIEPWYQTLRQLHRTHRVVIFGTDSRCIKAIRQGSGLPAFTLAHYATVDDLISRSPIRLVLYVNHNSGNFFMLRFPNLVHVSIMHGDSDKVVSISNQTKAYDFTFVAGQAAIDRLEAYLPMYNATQRCVVVGRPQADSGANKVTDNTAQAPRRWRVLYAPTWEGGVPSAAYSSLQAYGPSIIQALCQDDRFAVTYRPHPLTGVRLPQYLTADHALRQAVTQAAAACPEAGHRVSLGGEASAELAQADCLICDVSAMAIDFLPTTRPLVVTVPPEPDVVTAATRLLRSVPRLDRDNLPGLAAMMAEQITVDPGRSQRLEATEYYLGDVTPGVATASFVDACGQMIKLADQHRAELAARLASGVGE